jgi:ubiquinone/menaquinone biosynthesis C-methylase UbiE
MFLARTIARQARQPRGLLGRIVAWAMGHETSPENDRTVALLAVTPRDRVLEVGFGHGRTIEKLAHLATAGIIAGLDQSAAMLKVATARNREAVAAGRVVLTIGESATLPYADRAFDKACATHVLYFWRDPVQHLRELWRVLRPGGRLVVCVRDRPDAVGIGKYPPNIYHFYDRAELETLARQAGFRRLEFTSATVSRREIVWMVADV